MSGNTIANLAYLTFIAGLGAALICLCWERKPSETERATAANQRVGLTDDEWVYDGPDSLRLLEDTDAHLTQLAALDDDLTGAFGPGAPIPDLTAHPDFAAGCDRLRQAIRDEQQKEGQ